MHNKIGFINKKDGGNKMGGLGVPRQKGEGKIPQSRLLFGGTK